MNGEIEKITVRPAFRQPGVLIPASLLLVLFGLPAILFPGGAILLAVPPPLLLLGWLMTRAARLEITESEVRIRHSRHSPGRQAARSRIRAIHYYPDVVSFRGPDGNPLLRTRAEWSLKQMIAVAAELRVPVYDNRGRFKLMRVRVGQLVYDPADHLPAS